MAADTELSGEERRALKARANRADRGLKLGTAISELAKQNGVTKADGEALEAVIEMTRDTMTAEPIRFR